MTSPATERIYDHFQSAFAEATRGGIERRVGAELKFPFVDGDGKAVPPEAVDDLWSHLVDNGWSPDVDERSQRVVGASKPGERNETVASCETGYCKTEFSLAHAGCLDDLDATRRDVLSDLKPFLAERGYHLLSYGLQPVSPPSEALLMRKMRAGFWDKALPSNNVIPPDKGDDVHLFTVNACSHVHVSVMPDEAVRAVNILNGFAGAQLSLTANSPSRVAWTDVKLKCLNEKLWDWWEPVKGRVGVPETAFKDMHDYVTRVCELTPIYVKRDGGPVILCRDYDSFAAYMDQDEATGRDPDGNAVTVTPSMDDVSTHNSCYWYTARMSRYFTVENRVYDQQPADALLAPAALTLGLLNAAEEAWEEVASHEWADLRETRELACRHGFDWEHKGVSAADLAGRMLDIATLGLERHGRGEAVYLAPLRARLEVGRCPADDMLAIPDDNWPTALLEQHAI